MVKIFRVSTLILFTAVLMFMFGCSISHLSRDDKGIKFSNYSLGVDRKDISMTVKRDSADQYEAAVTIGDSNQTLGLTKAKEIGEALVKKGLVGIP